MNFEEVNIHNSNVQFECSSGKRSEFRLGKYVAPHPASLARAGRSRGAWVDKFLLLGEVRPGTRGGVGEGPGTWGPGTDSPFPLL